MQTQVSHSFSFLAGGDATQIQVTGWSVPEETHTWAVGTRSVVAIDNVVAPHGFFVEIDWSPFVFYPHVPDQSVLMTVLGHPLRPYRLTQGEIAAFYCPPLTEPRVSITFDCPDAARLCDFLPVSDTRRFSIALRRVRILPLAEPLPARVDNGSAVSVALTDNAVTYASAQGEGRMALRELVSRFEMLSGNCDFGLAVRALGVEQLSLLRFAGANTEMAIRGIETDFDGIGEQLVAEAIDNPIKEWMIGDAFGLRYHTHQSSLDISEADILTRQRRHIAFLRRKFLEDVESAEKIFIYADHLRPRTVESALSLFLALNRRGWRRMLWVCPNFEDTTPGRVDELFPRILARASLHLFDGPLIAGHIALMGWLNVLFNAAVVFKSWPVGYEQGGFADG